MLTVTLSCHKSMDTPCIVNSVKSNKVKTTQLAAMICLQVATFNNKGMKDPEMAAMIFPVSSACIKWYRHATTTFNNARMKGMNLLGMQHKTFFFLEKMLSLIIKETAHTIIPISEGTRYKSGEICLKSNLAHPLSKLS